MGRKYPPTVINATRAATEMAEWHREQERAARAYRPRVHVPAAPEPEPQPIPRPKLGRGKNIRVRKTPPSEATIAAVLDHVFGD